jgi:hypothetical protein
MKISESILIGIMLSPLVVILSLAVWVGVRSGAELGFVVGLLGFVFLGGIESTGFVFFALFKKWADADKKKAEEFDRKHRKENNASKRTKSTRSA